MSRGGDTKSSYDALFNDSLFGYRVVVSDALTDAVEKTVERTWKERWLSWPWKPWVTTKTIVEHVPSKEVLMTGDMLICHPAMEAEIREAIKAWSDLWVM